MGQNSKISWCDSTWNPWHGCKKVSEGCKYCYMYRDKERHGQKPDIVIRSKTMFNAPLKWAKNPDNTGNKIFTCSWSDFFIPEADEWRREAWDIIKQTPQFTYLILTKRPERMLNCLPTDYLNATDDGKRWLYQHIILGTSIENNKNISRISDLVNDLSSWQRYFISFEPLLEDVSIELLSQIAKLGLLNSDKYLSEKLWFIIGGESGNDTGKYKYRKCELEWFEKIIKLADVYNIPVFVKQAGTYIAKQNGYKERAGADISELPKQFQRQEFFREI